MSQNLELELNIQFKGAQEKYIYFLLAAAGSAIGFSITQLKIEPLDIIHIPVFVAISLWATSFVSGLFFAEYAASVTFQNLNYLAFKRELKSSPDEKNTELLSNFKSKLNKTVKNQQKKMKRYSRLQNGALLLGALSYIIGHIAQMWLKTA